MILLGQANYFVATRTIYETKLVDQNNPSQGQLWRKSNPLRNENFSARSQQVEVKFPD